MPSKSYWKPLESCSSCHDPQSLSLSFGLGVLQQGSYRPICCWPSLIGSLDERHRDTMQARIGRAVKELKALSLVASMSER